MKNSCINLKIKLDKSLFCKKKSKKILLKECTNCNLKKYKTQLKKKMHVKTCKLAKLEKNRFSIIYPNKNKCCLCSNTTSLTWHEIYRGSNRQNSMKYGLCLRLCIKCHERFQEDKNFNDYWHKKGQLAFIKCYPDLNFFDIFKINYL